MESTSHALAAAALLASGRARSVRVLGMPASTAVESTVTLQIPFAAADGVEVLFQGSVDSIERDAAARRRAACLRSAEARANVGTSEILYSDSESDDDERVDDSDSVGMLTLELAQPCLASSIGGKVWDASLLLSAFFAEHPQRLPPRERETSDKRWRVLELGAGLGIVGLSCAKLRPDLALTITDYDPAVLACIERNIQRNLPAGPRPEAVAIDFRDFTPEAVTAAEVAMAADQPLGDVASNLQRYADHGLLHSFDMIIGSDVVYDHIHGSQLPYVCRALLRERGPTGPLSNTGTLAWQPCAMFALPDSRPRLREFVESVPAAGLECTIERVAPRCSMVRRLKRVRDGWGADNAFSFYTLAWGAGLRHDP